MQSGYLDDPNRKPPIAQDGDGIRRDVANALNRVVDAVGERVGLPEGKAREWAYYALLQMINAAQQQSVSYDQYYSLKGDELLSVLAATDVLVACIALVKVYLLRVFEFPAVLV